MPTFAVTIDRFVRWFFNVSPLTLSIEPEPPRRRAAACPRRQARLASSSERRDVRAPRSTKPGRPTDKEVA